MLHKHYVGKDSGVRSERNLILSVTLYLDREFDTHKRYKSEDIVQSNFKCLLVIMHVTSSLPAKDISNAEVDKDKCLRNKLTIHLGRMLALLQISQ